MKTRFLIWAALFNLYISAIDASVNVRSTIFMSNDGLGNSVVRHIFQDSRGFLWMSTLNGLTRYDGHSFVTFRPGMGDEISLPGHHITRVAEDANQLLWINVSSEYFSCYDLKKGSFVDFTGCGEYKEKYMHRLEASNGDNWLWHHQNGVRKVSFNNGVFSSVAFKKDNGKLPSGAVKRVVEGVNGVVWICTGDGLVSISGDKSRIITTGVNILDAVMYKDALYYVTSGREIYKAMPENEEVERVCVMDERDFPFDITSGFLLQDDWIILSSEKGYVFSFSEEMIVPDRIMDVPNGRHIKDEDNLWIYNDKGLIRHVDVATRRVKDIQVAADNKIVEQWCRIIQDSRGLFWISTFGDGLYIYDPATEEMTHFTYRTEEVSHVCSNTLTSVMEDRSGGIWVTSEPSGISRIQVLNDGATYIYPEEKSQVGRMNTVRSIIRRSNGEIWLSNRNREVYVYDGKLKNKLRTMHFPSRIYKIFEDRNGKMWLGSRGSGLCIDGKWYRKQADNPRSVSDNNIYDIFCDYKQRIWVATFGGGLNLAVPEDSTYTFCSFLTDNNNMKFIRFVASDKNNWMWAGSSDGICVFHPDSLIESPDKYYRYNYNNGKLLGDMVKYILCDRKGRVWVGSLGGGLSMCLPDGDYENLSFKHFTTGNGLVGDDVQAIAEDDEGMLWVATEYGISHFSPETESFENFFFSTISQGNVYSESTACNLPDGRLLFGSSHGLVVIDPEKVKSPHVVSDVALTGLKVNGINTFPGAEDSPLTHAVSYTDHIELKHYQNSFVVEFSAFDYSMTNGAKYMYKLEPFDTDWNAPSSLNFAAYKKMVPGDYRLSVRACNSAGIWSDKEATLGIVITPPFWKSPVAYLIYVILLCVILYATYRLIRKFNVLRTRIEVEKQLTEYKLMFFTNISHEFRTPLTLIQGALEKIENMNHASGEMAYPIRLMNKSTDRMLRLINQLLEFRKMQNNKLMLMLEKTDVISFLKEIFVNFEDMADDKKMDFRFEHSEDSYFLFIDRGKLDKIVYNLLSNAFKYTPNGGKVLFSVSVDEGNKKLVFSVSDTGIGISKEKQQQLFSRFMQSSFSHDSVGIGLHLTHELVNVHKGSIAYHENKGGGSVFTVFLPLDTSLYEGKDFIISDSFREESYIHEKPEKYMEITRLSASGAEKKKILLIEDDSDVSKFLEVELSSYFEVITAADGLSGLDSARSLDLDIIVCDVLMPGMNGFEVTRKLKTDFNTSHIPIVLLTAMSTSENQLEGIESGADAYITKPFNIKLLLARISQLIEQREKLRNKFSNDPTLMNPVLSSAELDHKFAEKMNLIMEKQYANPDFTIDDFATVMKLGRTVFFRKVKGVTGYTPNEYMRVVRMKKAIELLQDGRYNVSEVTYMVGMKDPHYFSRSFKEQFGVSPSVYLHGGKDEHSR